MAVRTVLLDDRVPVELVAEISEKLAYVSDQVRSAQLSDDGARVDVVIDDPAAFAAADAQLRAMVSGLVRGYREVAKEVVWRHPAEPRHRAPIWDELLALGAIASSGPGCVALLGDACRVAAALDRRFAALGRDVFGAVDHQYPVLLARETLERCDYFASFPHHVTFAPHLRESMTAISDVANASREDRAGVVLSALSPPTHLLSPAVCYHTYAWLADRTIDAPVTVTALGRCFRWESTNFATCERLWDFSLREIMFVGSAEWVQRRRSEAMTQVQAIVEQLRLDAWIETANDPFFVTRFASKRYHQLLTQAKFELRLSLPYSGTSLAAASFNVHQEFFGRSFAVRTPEGGFASTGCVGFGLERWVWVLFAQHGPRIAGWPGEVRDALAL